MIKNKDNSVSGANVTDTKLWSAVTGHDNKQTAVTQHHCFCSPNYSCLKEKWPMMTKCRGMTLSEVAMHDAMMHDAAK